MSFKIQREEEQQQAQSGFHPSSGPSENESWERDTLYKLLMSVLCGLTLSRKPRNSFTTRTIAKSWFLA
ncbi:MAG: hypothetical protein ACFNKE_02270, partial [Neisseria elongata]